MISLSIFISLTHCVKCRYFTPHRGSGSPNIGYWAKAVGPMLVIALNSYSNMTRGSMQYQWLQEYLSTKIDRSATPWVVLMMHTPFYNSNSGHWKEAELGRVDIEPLLMEYGVDVVIAGHVHSYERIHPVYDFELNDCAPMYINIGDGGNYEGKKISMLPCDVMHPSYSKVVSYSLFRCLCSVEMGK